MVKFRFMSTLQDTGTIFSTNVISREHISVVFDMVYAQNKGVTSRITHVGTFEVFVHTFSKPSPDPLLSQNPCSQYNKDLIYEMWCWLSKMAIFRKVFNQFSLYDDWSKRKGK